MQKVNFAYVLRYIYLYLTFDFNLLSAKRVTVTQGVATTVDASHHSF